MVTSATQRSITFLYKELGIGKELYTTGHKRGIYFAHFYDNFKEYLRKEITEKELIPRTDIKYDVKSLSEYWIEKHAYPRILFLNSTILKPDGKFKELTNRIKLPDGKTEKRTKPSKVKYNWNPFTLDFEVFYTDLATMTWEETKKKYLPYIGNWKEKQDELK